MACKTGTLANTPDMRAMCNAAVMRHRADVEVAEVVEMAQPYKDWQHCQQAGRVDIEEVVAISA